MHAFVTLISTCDEMTLTFLDTFDESIMSLGCGNLLTFLLIPNFDYFAATRVNLTIAFFKGINRVVVSTLNGLDLLESALIFIDILLLFFPLSPQFPIVLRRIATAAAL